MSTEEKTTLEAAIESVLLRTQQWVGDDLMTVVLAARSHANLLTGYGTPPTAVDDVCVDAASLREPKNMGDAVIREDTDDMGVTTSPTIVLLDKATNYLREIVPHDAPSSARRVEILGLFRKIRIAQQSKPREPLGNEGWMDIKDWTDDCTNGDEVLVCWNDGTVEAMHWAAVETYEQKDGITTFVTHWQSLPSPPSTKPEEKE